MAKDVLITPLDGIIQFSSSAGAGTGQVKVDGDDLVISNLVGDVLLGDGASDVFIGNGSDSVDIVFEQNGEIRDDGSGKTITIGSKTTTLILSSSSDITLQGGGGNVGIGTTAATVPLQVTGDISQSGNFITQGHITASGKISSSGGFVGDGSGLSNVSATVSGDTFATDLKIGRDSDNHIDFTSDNVIIFDINNASELRLNATALRPHTNNGLALGSTSTSWSDLYLADGGFITFNNGDAVITQTGAEIELSGSGATRLNIEGELTASGKVLLSSTASFGEIKLNDDNRIKLGDAGDLQIYHNGSNSVISDQGTGDLLINGANVRIRDANDGNTIALFTQGAGVEMRHDNTVRFETTTTGVKVSGNISSSSHITASGNISSSGEIAGATLDINGTGNISGDTTFGGHIILNADNKIKSDTSGTNNFLEFDDDSGSPENQTLLSSITNVALIVDGNNNGTGQFEVLKGGTDGTATELFRIENGGNLKTTSHITASGNISSSGTIIAEHLETTDDLTVADDINLGDLSLISFGGAGRGKITGSALNLIVGPSDLVIQTGSANTAFRIDTSAKGNVGIEGVADLIIKNNITSSVDSKFQWGVVGGNRVQIQDGHITASGNISASGKVITTEVESPTDFTLDVEGDITLDANGADIILSDDGTDFGRFKRDSSDFIIKSEANNNDIVFRGQDGGATITALTLDMSEAGKAIFTGDISASGNIITNVKQHIFSKTGNTDAEAQGDVVFLGGTTSMDAGKIYHYKSDGTWELADADAVATSDGLLAVALGAASDVNGMLLRGTVTLDHDPGAVGDVLFLSTTSGQATATAPSGNTDIVRVIGYCLDASNGQIWFNPDNTFVEVSA